VTGADVQLIRDYIVGNRTVVATVTRSVVLAALDSLVAENTACAEAYERATEAMTHWLGKANDADAALASARATLADIADGRWDEKRTDQSQSPSDWARATARAALAGNGATCA
jgi:hypothetical protein